MNLESTKQIIDIKDMQGGKSMNIIGISASSRKEGNTAWIVNKILEGAKEQGAETQYFDFNNLDIKPCQGCWACHKGDQGVLSKMICKNLMMQLTVQMSLFSVRRFI